MDGERSDEEPRRTAAPGYALGRLRRAMETAVSHPDPVVRGRAEQKALAWEAVLSGMNGGTLSIGSRTPVADTPAWVTLEVAQGGFATGRYLAEGPLADDEVRLLDEIPTAADEPGRRRLNTWFLSDDGLDRLTELLRSGLYAIEVPEQAALLVVAFLVDAGHDAAALDLVATLYPLFDRLRFYPVARESSPPSGAVVHVRTVGQVTDQLRAATVPPQVAAMHETITVWHPLYDRLTALWLQTVEDDWPCARWPPDWREQRQQWLDDYEQAARDRTLSREHTRPRSNFATMRSALVLCEDDSQGLTGRDVGKLRRSLRCSTARWGPPGSERRDALRQAQRQEAARPTHRDLAAVLAERLSRFPATGGVSELEGVLEAGPVEWPPSLVHKVERVLEAPIEELIERGVITSSEVIAQVLPQISSHVAATAFVDPALRDLYAKTYAAFRRRRSLLLLNLEHQVQIGELPWVAALEPLRVTTPTGRIRAAGTLEQVTWLALTSFPQTILPNPLVKEMRALAQQAEMEIPLVEDAAADIFMGTFTTKWRKAASVTAAVMSGTLYARYYDLPKASTWAEADDGGHGLIERAKLRWGKQTAEDFAAICAERAREAHAGDGSHVAHNGAILEQSQILTSHNLAPLIDRLDLSDRLRPRAADLAAAAFAWIIRQQNIRIDDLRSQLQMLKNTAYAWRQAIFYLSFLDPTSQQAALAALRATMAARPIAWQQRFEPAVAGLEAVITGATFDPTGHVPGGRRFLGWSIGPHWLAPPPPPEPSTRAT